MFSRFSKIVRWSSRSATHRSSASATILLGFAAFVSAATCSTNHSREASGFGPLFSGALRLGDQHLADSGQTYLAGSRPNFSYGRLLREEKTRILILEPGQLEAELRARWKHVTFLEDHEYVALSYIWGKEPRISRNLCPERGIQITPNLDAAFGGLRKPEDHLG